MNALAINRDQGQARHVKAAAFRCGMGRGAPAADHRQSSARNSSHAPTGRRIAVGRFYSDISQVREVMAREHTGLLPEVIRAVVDTQAGHHVRQDTADVPKSTHVQSLSQKTEPSPGVLNGCQQGMPKNWESLPKRRSE